jgi:hypothetical protein
VAIVVLLSILEKSFAHACICPARGRIPRSSRCPARTFDPSPRSRIGPRRALDEDPASPVVVEPPATLLLPCSLEPLAASTSAPAKSGTKRERRDLIVALMFPENEAAHKSQKSSIVVAPLNDGARLLALGPSA